MAQSKWTPEEAAAVDSAFAAICELYNKIPSVGLISIYMCTLEPFPAEEALRALKEAICTLKFFPKPSELAEILCGSKEEHALKAWTILSKAVANVGTWRDILFEDPRLCAVVKYFGGWEEIGKWEMREMDFRRTEFVKAYSNYDNPPPSTLLPGAGSRMAALSYFPDLTPWAAVAKNGEVTHMRRLLADNGRDIISLPESKHPALPAHGSLPDNGNGKDLVPITSVMKKIAGIFKSTPKEAGEQN